MKTLTLDLIKKNRVYFKCFNEKGYPVKLKISEKSKDLTLGKHDLLVEDISIHSKYGSDIIYALEDVIKPNDKPVLLKHRYNKDLVENCRNLGGRWDHENKTWAFPSIVSDKVEDLDYLYNENIVDVEITAIENVTAWHDSVSFCGYPLAKATGRDSGAVVCDDVSLIAGKIYSGGSSKNWITDVSIGATFRLKISKNLLEKYKEDEWKIKILTDKGE